VFRAFGPRTDEARCDSASEGAQHTTLSVRRIGSARVARWRRARGRPASARCSRRPSRYLMASYSARSPTPLRNCPRSSTRGVRFRSVPDLLWHRSSSNAFGDYLSAATRPPISLRAELRHDQRTAADASRELTSAKRSTQSPTFEADPRPSGPACLAAALSGD
jgi:hypothetical protein